MDRAAEVADDGKEDECRRSKPTLYAVSIQDRTINPELQRLMAKRMGVKTIEMEERRIVLAELAACRSCGAVRNCNCAERTYQQNKHSTYSHFHLHSFVRPEHCKTAPVSSELRIEISTRIELQKSDRPSCQHAETGRYC
jgi:hypothetical protein